MKIGPNTNFYLFPQKQYMKAHFLHFSKCYTFGSFLKTHSVCQLKSLFLNPYKSSKIGKSEMVWFRNLDFSCWNYSISWFLAFYLKQNTKPHFLGTLCIFWEIIKYFKKTKGRLWEILYFWGWSYFQLHNNLMEYWMLRGPTFDRFEGTDLRHRVIGFRYGNRQPYRFYYIDGVGS